MFDGGFVSSPGIVSSINLPIKSGNPAKPARLRLWSSAPVLNTPAHQGRVKSIRYARRLCAGYREYPIHIPARNLVVISIIVSYIGRQLLTARSAILSFNIDATHIARVSASECSSPHKPETPAASMTLGDELEGIAQRVNEIAQDEAVRRRLRAGEGGHRPSGAVLPQRPGRLIRTVVTSLATPCLCQQGVFSCADCRRFRVDLQPCRIVVVCRCASGDE